MANYFARTRRSCRADSSSPFPRFRANHMSSSGVPVERAGGVERNCSPGHRVDAYRSSAAPILSARTYRLSSGKNSFASSRNAMSLKDLASVRHQGSQRADDVSSNASSSVKPSSAASKYRLNAAAICSRSSAVSNPCANRRMRRRLSFNDVDPSEAPHGPQWPDGPAASLH